MKVIYDNLHAEGIEGDGNIVFTIGSHIFNIGELDGIHWVSRMTIEDYESGNGSWEKVEKWIPENKPVFRLLTGYRLP